MLCRRLLVDKSDISPQLEPWFCPPYWDHYYRSQVGMEQFTPQIMAQKSSNLLNGAFSQILRYFCKSLSWNGRAGQQKSSVT
jgi:hypothetical protein